MIRADATVESQTAPPASFARESGAARLVPVSGYLGAGKTAALLRLGAALRQKGSRPAFLRRTEPVDGAVFSSAWADARLKYFAGTAESFAATAAAAAGESDFILAELPGDTVPEVFTRAVAGGSRIVSGPLSVLVDAADASRALALDAGARLSPNLLYLFRQQLVQADLIVIAKTDVVSPAKVASLRAALENKFANAMVLPLSNKTGEGLEEWLHCILVREPAHRSEPADVAILREAAAALGFLNCTVRLSSVRYFDGAKLLMELAASIQAIAQQESAEIAHLKMALRSPLDNSVAAVNLVRNDAAPCLSQDLSEPIQNGSLFVTVRAEADPEVLHSIVNRALLAMMEKAPELFARMEHCEHFSTQEPVSG